MSTPFEDGRNPVMSRIKSASELLAPVLRKVNLVIRESTLPVGATEQLGALLAERCPTLRFSQSGRADADIHLVHCLKRLLSGQVLTELVEIDRVIGGTAAKSIELATVLCKAFVKDECLPTDLRTPEPAKLTENACCDVNIAFSDELSLICDPLGIDVWALIGIANRYPRINILQPGLDGGRRIADSVEISIPAVEPNVQEMPEELRMLSIVCLVSEDDAAVQAPTAALLADHEAFRDIDRRLLARKTVVATQGFWR